MENELLGIYIREKYKEKGLTQQEYADKCGLSENTIRNIEKRKCKDIRMSTYKALAKGLDITTSKLLEDAKVIKPLNKHQLDPIQSIKFIEAIDSFAKKCDIDLNILNDEQKFYFANEIMHFINLIVPKC